MNNYKEVWKIKVMINNNQKMRMKCYNKNASSMKMNQEILSKIQKKKIKLLIHLANKLMNYSYNQNNKKIN